MLDEKLLDLQKFNAGGGIEPPTGGFSARFRRFQWFINQSLAASCRPVPTPRHNPGTLNLSWSHIWHCTFELRSFTGAFTETCSWTRQFLASVKPCRMRVAATDIRRKNQGHPRRP